MSEKILSFDEYLKLLEKEGKIKRKEKDDFSCFSEYNSNEVTF